MPPSCIPAPPTPVPTPMDRASGDEDISAPTHDATSMSVRLAWSSDHTHNPSILPTNNTHAESSQAVSALGEAPGGRVCVWVCNASCRHTCNDRMRGGNNTRVRRMDAVM